MKCNKTDMKQLGCRNLRIEEIIILEKRGCVAESWDNVTVSDKFNPELIKNADFGGKVVLGDNVIIEDVGLISNYVISDNARLSHIGKIFTDEDSLFGNGVKVNVLSEAGGRDVMIYENISSHIAYMMSLYRYESNFISALKSMIEKEVEKHRSSLGVIGENVVVENVKYIKDVNIGDNAGIYGAAVLENGTIVSGKSSPSVIGCGVICRNFIIQSNSEVSDYVTLESSFVGQGCVLSKGFSASNSLFFANSHLENGEAAALFAGPCTVSHHKSTLLIGTMFSFMNAGSATNFSNHLYKSGPVHYGIFGRGVKFSSGSYMMLPVKVGAFSTIIGHHSAHIDTSDFPYSYIVEYKGKTKLIPGIALNNSGLFRDSQKWPVRDKRSLENRIDNINFDVINPSTYFAMKRGLETLKRLSEKCDSEKDLIEYGGFVIDGKSLERGIGIYSGVIAEYPMTELCRLLMKYDLDYIRKIAQVPALNDEFGKWSDISGMFAPAPMIKALVNDVVENNLNDISGLNLRLSSIFDSYDENICHWLSSVLPTELIRSHFGKDEMDKYFGQWKESLLARLNIILKDAEKELLPPLTVGFGADGSEEDIEKDVSAVRGTSETNPLCRAISDIMEKVEKISL